MGVFAVGAGAQTNAVSFPLELQTNGFSLYVGLDFDAREVVFKREPAYDGRTVVRGSLVVGAGRQDFVGFVWDPEKRTLRLDRNRNLDLTDDPEDTAGSHDDYYQAFDNLQLAVENGGVVRPYTLDLKLYKYERGAHGNVDVRSGWQGTIELGGATCTLAVADNLDGVVDERDELRLEAAGGEADDASPDLALTRLPGSRRLFVRGRAYDVTYRFEGAGSGSRLLAVFAPAAAAMGELRLEGTRVARLILRGERAVILDRPGPTSPVPAGDYHDVSVFVDGGRTTGLYEASIRQLRVAAGQPTTLRAGGPLTNRVDVRRTGRTLAMDYQLVGAGGETYRAQSRDRDRKPQVTIYKGGEAIHSGTFEYG